MTGGGGNDTYFVDAAGDQVVEAAGGGTDLVMSAIGHTLGANVENLVLDRRRRFDANGNGLANEIIGNRGANLLDGGAGRRHARRRRWQRYLCRRQCRRPGGRDERGEAASTRSTAR